MSWLLGLLLGAQLAVARPTVVLFSGPWCGACVAMEPVWKSFVQQNQGRFHTVYVDVDQVESPAYVKYGHLWEEDRHMPQLLWIDGQGRVLERRPGFVPLQELQRWRPRGIRVVP